MASINDPLSIIWHSHNIVTMLFSLLHHEWHNYMNSIINYTPNDSIFRAVTPLETLKRVFSMCYTLSLCSFSSIYALYKCIHTDNGTCTTPNSSNNWTGIHSTHSLDQLDESLKKDKTKHRWFFKMKQKCAVWGILQVTAIRRNMRNSSSHTTSVLTFSEHLIWYAGMVSEYEIRGIKSINEAYLTI